MPFLELDDTLRELTGETTVGSGAQVAWRVQNKDLGARHFAVTVDAAGNATVTPASAQNVVILNGRQVPAEGAPLKAGDVISAGFARFAYLATRNDARPAAAAATTQAYLVDSVAREAHPLTRKATPIGRDAAAGVQLRDTMVSRHHADVRQEAGGYVLYSSGQTGTKLNGQAVSAPVLLNEGDQIQISNSTLTFTRNALPAGIKLIEPTHREEDVITRRSTVMGTEAIPTGEVSAIPGGSKMNPAIIAVIVVVVLALVWYFFLRT